MVSEFRHHAGRLARAKVTKEGRTFGTYRKVAPRAAMLLPKPRKRREIIPPMPASELIHLKGELGPDERKALRALCPTADLFVVGDQAYLLAPVTPALVDTLPPLRPRTRSASPMTCRRSTTRPSSMTTTRPTATPSWNTDSRWPHRHQLTAPLRRGFLCGVVRCYLKLNTRGTWRCCLDGSTN